MEKIVAAINRLIANTYGRNIAESLTATVNECVWRVYEIRIYMCCLYRLSIVEDKLIVVVDIRKAHNYDVYVSL